jgi:hypothetical protein
VAEVEALAQDSGDPDFWEKETPAWAGNSWGFNARRFVNGQLNKDAAVNGLELIFQRRDMTRAELAELISSFRPDMTEVGYGACLDPSGTDVDVPTEERPLR